jgi:hypothetical protein
MPVESVQCADTVDNDGDGKIDFPDDPGCSNATDDTEDTDKPVCTVNCGNGNGNGGGGGGGGGSCTPSAATQWYVTASWDLYTDSSCTNVDRAVNSQQTFSCLYGSGCAEPFYTSCTNSIDTGNSCVPVGLFGEYGKCFYRSPITDNSVVCQAPQGGPVSGFTVSGTPKIAIQFLAGLGATSQPANISINPSSGFSSPVVLSVESIRTANGVSLPSGVTPTYYFDGSPSASALMSYNPSFGQYVNPSGTIGTTFAVRLPKKITEKYYIQIVGTSGSQRSTFTIELDPNAINPDFREI